MRSLSAICAGLCFCTAAAAQSASSSFDVAKYGAVGNGNRLNSAATNEAIEAAHAAGGGTDGRINFGTESSGGFKNITISKIVFDYCRGLALESVDGGHLEDVTISKVTMRDIANSPIFLRLGSRMRSPEGTPVGELRRVNITNFVVYNADPRYGSIISGIPGHDNNVKGQHASGDDERQAVLGVRFGANEIVVS